MITLGNESLNLNRKSRIKVPCSKQAYNAIEQVLVMSLIEAWEPVIIKVVEGNFFESKKCRANGCF